jgi:hypothetical protein
VLTKHLTADPDVPSERVPKAKIPPEVDDLCLRALEREPDDRWQTAADLGAAIEEVYHDTVEATGPRSLPKRPGTLLFEERVTASDLRLRRSDIDAYETNLRRRRWLTGGFMLLCAAGAAAGLVWYATRPPPALTVEDEPNDDAINANRIAINTPVTGYLGRRRSVTEGDRDAYRVDLSSERHLITVRVTGLPNMDINLSIADRDGLHATVMDEGGIGAGEAIHRRAVDGSIIVTVGETRPPGIALPVENVSDPYTLTVTEEKPAGGEIEPNGIEADANPLVLGEQIRGYLDTRDDIDLLRWTGGDGTYNVTVHVDGVEVVWQTSTGVQRTAGLAKIELKHDEIIRITRKGPPPAKPDAWWAIVVTP